jgi:hypothetical protein
MPFPREHAGNWAKRDGGITSNVHVSILCWGDALRVYKSYLWDARAFHCRKILWGTCFSAVSLPQSEVQITRNKRYCRLGRYAL